MASSSATAYTDPKTGALSSDLKNLLEESKVQEVVAIWLAEQRVVEVEAFADLAESKQGIQSRHECHVFHHRQTQLKLK